MREAITPPIAKKNIDTVNKTKNPQESKKKDKSISNKSDKDKSFDKSRSTKITETEETEKNEINQDLFHHLVYLIKVTK